MLRGGIEITLIITATGGLIIYGLVCIALVLRAARVPAIPEEAKRAAPTPGRVADTARSQKFARHIAHDGSATR